MELWERARDIAVVRATHYRNERANTTKASERTALSILIGQYLKAAVEITRGNHPKPALGGTAWLVESRSTLVGNVLNVEFDRKLIGFLDKAQLQIAQGLKQIVSEDGEITDTPPELYKLHVHFQGGDVYLYDLKDHSCTCAAKSAGCWHGCMIECWLEALGAQELLEDFYATAPVPDEVWMSK